MIFSVNATKSAVVTFTQEIVNGKLHFFVQYECFGFYLSSIVNDGIREFYTFLQEDPTRTKSIKRT